MITRSSRAAAHLTLAVVLAAGTLVGLTAGATHAAKTTPLVGTFTVTPGANAGSSVSGSYFRMIQPGGTATGGPFLSNNDSSAANKTYTYLSPGSDGGLRTGSYQPAPNPAFDLGGNALAGRIIAPKSFFGVNFSGSTQSPDPQTSAAVPAPSITVDNKGKVVAADVRAFGAWWGGSTFNQGSPKPSGSAANLTGTVNKTTKAYTLQWTSLIVDGPFNGFTGLWHLTGTFTPAPLNIVTTSLPPATRGVPYTAQIHTDGRIVKFKRIGNLPKGLKLRPKTGVIEGTPKLRKVGPGNYSFTITATEKKTKFAPAQTDSQAYTLVLN